ncbi:MAG TPA: glutathione peroxidase [Mycobacteriales bacterium]|nr:glutathione peroxidase [Mycobacteriales bacterium]
MSDLLNLPVTTLSGTPSTFGDLAAGKIALVVNVASRCGLTPQYEKLEALQRALADKPFTVLGFPCNQFGEQEPGTDEEIATFCSATYGVTFPIATKIDVNGDGRDAVYDVLTETPDAEGAAGDIQWNFEKFVVGVDGSVLGRFRPLVEPDAPELLACIASALGS